MDNLIIEPTETSPRIQFDPNTRVFEIIGDSRPESVREFYEPMLNWLEDFSAELLSMLISKPTGDPIIITFNFKLHYFNSSSAKYFLDILKKLIAKFYSKGVELKVFWYYEDDDEDMLEAGEELSHMVKFPFKYIPVKVKKQSQEKKAE